MSNNHKISKVVYNIFTFVIIFCIVTFGVQGIAIDNGVTGDPEIECGPDSITVGFNTHRTFEGNVFVKGQFQNDECRSKDLGSTYASIKLPFDKCSVERVRTLEPRGIFVRTTVIISFHRMFITKVDRAYRVQCFYMEADKTVSEEIVVSMLTTVFQTKQVPMPVCRYEILESGPSGPPVRYVVIGQQVYHKWTCDTDTVDVFCMTVNSCFVSDGADDRVELLDRMGCAKDKYLLQNLEYSTDLMAGKEAHVFKYADRPQLQFQCQISITIKEPNTVCVRPQCPEPTRGKRDAPKISENGYTPYADYDVLDVQSQPITAFDISEDIDSNNGAFAEDIYNTQGTNVQGNEEYDIVCMPHSAFLTFIIVSTFLILILTGSTITIFVTTRRLTNSFSSTVVKANK